MSAILTRSIPKIAKALPEITRTLPKIEHRRQSPEPLVSEDCRGSPQVRQLKTFEHFWNTKLTAACVRKQLVDERDYHLQLII